MAANPMQRKTRFSFILGMLVMLLIAAVVVMLLFVQIKKLKQEKQDLINGQPATVAVYKLTERVASGEEIFKIDEEKGTMINAKQAYVDASIVPSNAITDETIRDKEGKVKSFKSLLDLEPGTIITESMITDNTEEMESLRTVEYNMITLPTELKQDGGQYIDIRIAFPTGADYIVASKKYVKKSNSSTIWLDIGEKDMLTINCAIIESYIAEGTKIYAVLYSDATQNKLDITYIPNTDVMELVTANGSKFTASEDMAELMQKQRQKIEDILGEKSTDEKAASVEAGFSTEEQALKSAREEFLGEIGY